MTVPTLHGAPSEGAPPDYPIHIGDAHDFEVVRTLFQRARYDESTVASRLGSDTRLSGAPRLCDGRKSLAGAVEDVNAALIRLLWDGEPLSRALLATMLEAHELESLERLGVLARVGNDDRKATVVLAPIRGLWLASDLVPAPGDTWEVAQDFVYSALNKLTAEFLAVIPDTPGGEVLELCAGSGVGALYSLLRGAAHATATDVAGRSVHFSLFNAHLNGLADRFSARQSDVWDALGDATYDLVVAHPPYVPALAHIYDFRDAGADGEQVSRRIVEGLPLHVRPGGRAVIRSSLSDRRGAPVLSRLRAWLAESQGEFDIVQLEREPYSVLDYYKSITRGGKDFEDLERWMRHFHSLEIERFVLSLIEMRREAVGRPPISEHRTTGAHLSPGIADWLFAWAHFVASDEDTREGRLRRLARSTPRVPVGTRAAVHLSHESDGWHTVGASVETVWPTHVAMKAPAFVPTLLELCDGTRGVQAILDGLRSAGLVNDAVDAGDVAHLIETLAAGGALELRECPLPPYPGARR